MKNQNLIIRFAELKDQERIINFQIACAKETEGLDLSYKVVERGVLMIFSFTHTNSPLGQYIVAVNEKDEVVGCCLFQFQFSDWNCGIYLNIESVYVDYNYRGIGVMQKMYSFAEVYSTNRGDVSEIRSTVLLKNKPMIWALEKINVKDSGYSVFRKKSEEFNHENDLVERWSKGRKYYL